MTLENDHPEVFTACVVTRSGGRSHKLVDVKTVWLICLAPFWLGWLEWRKAIIFPREALIKAQCQELPIASLRKTAMSLEESQGVATGYYLHHNVPMRKWHPANEHWTVLSQVVLPSGFRRESMCLGHESAWAGDFGVRKTPDRVIFTGLMCAKM